MSYATLVIVHDPYHPARHREVRGLDAPGPLSAIVPETDRPHILMRNGVAVLRKDWGQAIERGDLVAVVMLPQGGGGGSNPLRLVLMIVVAYFTAGLGGALLGVNGAAAVGSVGVAIANAAVGMIGAALVNAIVPVKTASSSASSAAAASYSSSPTYSLTAQGNAARLEAPIPVQYGRMLSFPDFAALPFVEYAGNEQYLYQLLCIGAGQYDIETIRIADTAITNFEDVETQIVPPGGTLTLFPANVVTSEEVAGQEALTGTWLGPFTANAAETTANFLGVDVVAPRGIYYANDSGGLNEVSMTFTVQARAIDANGNATSGWTTLGTHTLPGATATAQRYSFKYAVNAGRYEVRLQRTDTKQTSTRYGHELDWSGLRAYLPETDDYGNVTLLAVKMRATNNLSSQSSRKINVISTRKLPIWNGSSWSAPTATRSIAWALADAARDADYGGGLADSRLDLDGLLALDGVWSARGDRYNARFDTLGTLWDALTQIGRAGRSKPYMQGGLLYVARDQAVSVPVAMYSMRNIVKGSFSLEYITPSDDTADSVSVSYYDENAWATRRVPCTLPDSASSKPAKIDLFGVTDREQAHHEGLYFAAANRYRRTVMKFQTEMEGFIPSFADLIAVSHDMPQWGQSFECVAWDAGTRTLRVSEPITWEYSINYVALRRRDGSVDGPIAVTPGLSPEILENGDASLGSNAHFSQLTYATSDGYGGGPHFTYTGPAGEILGDDWIPIEADPTYKLRGAFRCEAASNLTYAGVVCYDADKRVIPIQGSWRDPGKTTTLYEPAAEGSTSVKILPAAEAWFAPASPSWPAGSFLQLGIELGFSDLPQLDCPPITAIDTSNPAYWVLVLGAPLVRAWAAGTPVGNSHAGSTYTYALLAGPVTSTWTEFSGSMSRQLDFSVEPGSSTLRAGTKYVRMLVLANYTTPDTLHVDALSLKKTDPRSLILADEPDEAPYTGLAAERTQGSFGWGDTWAQLARVVAIRPRSMNTVEIEAINEDPSVHTADQGVVAPPVKSSQLPTYTVAPLLKGLTARSMPGHSERMILSWQPSPWANYYLIEQSSDGINWVRSGEPSACNYTATALYGAATIIRVCAVGLEPGPWVQVNYSMSSDYMWTNDANAMWTNDSNLMWRY
ncbi:host specificity factor TipJ family phage tail protein [Propionivibrio sp.]|uniref:host specificity factor TipJ family phage tail protein n=1 Tax=Propionivibrio sp. TaxID=2212460 RepID=UPI0039E709C8